MKPFDRICRTVKFGIPARRPSRPILLIYHVTTACNMACLHCGDDVWGDPKDDLTLEEIGNFTRTLGGIESVALGGGEPFLRRDLPEICRLFARNNKVSSIGIPSNGFATKSICTAVREILTTCPGLFLDITLSLDGVQQTHDAIRTPGSYHLALETARALKAMAAEFPRLALNFNATIHSKNWQELPSLADFVRGEFHARLECNVISGTPRDCAFTPPSRQQLGETLGRLLNSPGASTRRRMYNELYRDILVQTNSASGQVIPCRAGSLVGLIDANGALRACPRLPPFGNVRHASFSSIWQSDAAKRQFGAIIAGACSCNNDCFIRISLEHYWKLHWLLLLRAMGRGLSR